MKMYFYVYQYAIRSDGSYSDNDIHGCADYYETADRMYIGEAEVEPKTYSQEAVIEQRIEALRAVKQRLREEFTVQIDNIDEKIQSLLSITHQPED